jgi:hypothetical protein
MKRFAQAMKQRPRWAAAGMSFLADFFSGDSCFCGAFLKKGQEIKVIKIDSSF